MLAADDVWAGTGGWAPGGITRPDEELLAGLGAAARLFGELEDALRDPAPAGVTLDTAGAFRFLKETGPLLAGAGFGVLLPDWARKARLGLKLTSTLPAGTTPSASASAPSGSGFGLNDLVEFRYDLAVGRHHARRRRASRAGPAEDPPGPGPGPVGGAGRGQPPGRAEVHGARPRGRDARR